MTVLICSDRDGTINHDENFYLGSQEDWQEKISLLPTVIEGIRLLNNITDSHFFILSAQSGVARKDYPYLDEARMVEVQNFILSLLEKEHLQINGSFLCPYVTSTYAKKRDVHETYIDDSHEDIKPRIGMLKKAAKMLHKSLDEIESVFMIGDRASDVEVGLSAGGCGILIPAFKTGDDIAKVEALQKKHPGKVFIAKNYLEAAEWIKKNSN